MRIPHRGHVVSRFGLVAILAAGGAACAPVPTDRAAPQPPAQADRRVPPAATAPAASTAPEFPLGTATPSELCGACHQAIYREFATGFGSDLEYKAIVYQSAAGRPLTLPANVSGTPALQRTRRQVAEGFDVPVRAVARHLWTGGHSVQRLRTALNLVILQGEAGRPRSSYT